MKKSLLLSLGAALGLVGCADQYGNFAPPDPIGQLLFGRTNTNPGPQSYSQQQYYVTRDMPPQRYNQHRPPSPRRYSDPVWVDGYWAWSRNDWVWVPGRWVQRPRQNAYWVEGQYYNTPQGRVWNSGYWR